MVGCWAAFALVTARVPLMGYEQPMLLRSAHGSSTGGVACGRRAECRRTVAEPALEDHSPHVERRGLGCWLAVLCSNMPG